MNVKNKLHTTQALLSNRRKRIEELNNENEFLQEVIFMQDKRLDKMKDIYNLEFKDAKVV